MSSPFPAVEAVPASNPDMPPPSSQDPTPSDARLVSARFGPVSRRIFRRFFDPVHFPQDAEERLRAHAREGTPIYVMRSAGVLNYLFFTWALAKRGLPLPSAVVGLPRFLHRILSLLVGLPARSGVDELVRSLEDGASAMVFLRRPAFLRSKGTAADDPFVELVALQRRLDRPLLLIPQILIFKRAPVRLRPGIRDVILGSAEVPGKIHTFVSFLANHRRSVVKVGLPIDLAQALAREAQTSDEVVARKVRGSLGVGLARELRAVVGPPLKPAERMIDETLRDRILRRELDREAKRSGKDRAAVEREARKDLEGIAAKYSPAVLDGANAAGRWLFGRLYDGIHVDEEGLRIAAEVSKRAPLVICPTHRSHIDYIAVTHVMVDRGMTPPLVAAGANLSFWPLGPFLRRAGAFFIRRGFRGDKVYAAVLAAYIRKLIRDGYTQEFYPEGGRTRTGRILEPKLGLLTMQVDAWLAGTRDDLYFVPVAIDYAKLIEVESYSRELSGGEKVSESIRELLKAPKILSRKWGQIHLQVDEPISLASFVDALEVDRRDMPPPAKKKIIRSLGQRIAWGMGRVQTITGSALVASALQGARREAETLPALRERVELLAELARTKGSRFAPKVEEAFRGDLDGFLLESLAGFAEDGFVESEVIGGETYFRQRTSSATALAFYRNNISQHFTYESLLATALLRAPSLRVTREEAGEVAEWLMRRLDGNLLFDPLISLEEGLEEAASRLVAAGILQETEDGWAAPRRGIFGLVLLRSFLRDLIEAHLIVAVATERLAAGPLERKELLRLCFDTGRRLLATGRVRCPEASSKLSFEQGLLWLSKEGALASQGAKIALAGAFVEQGAREALGKELMSLLREP